MPEISTVLVTGAAGFVGTHVVRAARRAGWRVLCHARRLAPGIDWHADLCDAAAVAALPLDDIPAVIHCAAAIPSRSQPFAQDNARGGRVLSDALAEAKALHRVVHVSSVAVYRRPLTGTWPICEEAAVVDPADETADAYARSKRAVELALDSVTQRRPNVAVCHLRASSVYGEGMALTTLLPTLVQHAWTGAPLVLRGPRAYRQNFVHVDDVATLAVALAGGVSDSAINAFSDDTYGLFELADLIRTRLKSLSAVVDETQNTAIAVPTFDNHRAKRVHPCFRALAENLERLATR